MGTRSGAGGGQKVSAKAGTKAGQAVGKRTGGAPGTRAAGAIKKKSVRGATRSTGTKVKGAHTGGAAAAGKGSKSRTTAGKGY
jgi:hypothetical protein